LSEGLQKRIVTAAVLVAILLAVLLLLPPVATVIALTLLVLAGAWEWSAFLRAPGTAMRITYVVAIGVLLPVVWQVTRTPQGLNAVMAIAVVWWLAALAWIILAPTRVQPWSAAVAGILALVPAWVALLRLRLDLERGAEWTLFALVLVWAADVGGFFFGRRYGSVRLAPQVSPGKTWEGVLGGMALSAVVAVLGSYWFDLEVITFVPLCLAVVAFSIVGDLTESLLKRFAGVKDSGTLFPGHGGVMDRIDSVTGAAPVLFLGLMALNVAT
jgi:phosphatidate cytidylyltransferase